jgi:hypothetical protein
MEAGSACLLAAAKFIQTAGNPDPRDRRRLRWALAEQALFRPHSVSRADRACRSRPPRALTAGAGQSHSFPWSLPAGLTVTGGGERAVPADGSACPPHSVRASGRRTEVRQVPHAAVP